MGVGTAYKRYHLMKLRRTADRVRLAAWLGLVCAIAPMTARANPASDAYYERTVMSAADGRCRLFTPDIAAALAASQAQARGAALRTGADSASLQSLAAQARSRAEAAPCGSPDLTTAAGRVRAAFDGYSRLPRMSFPGEIAAWRADRTYSLDGPTWRLAQTGQLGAQAFTFGLAGRRGEVAQLMVVADFGPGPGPYAARLLMRDPARAPDAYLNLQRASMPARLPLSARTPPRPASRIVSAEARAQAEPRLLTPGQSSATAFRFPASAAAAIAGLDPREAVALEFVFMGRNGDIVRTAYVEVGDFAAGQAFLTVAAR